MLLEHETLLKVAKQGFMSRRLQLKDIIASVQNDPSGQPSTSHAVPSFCVCGHCWEIAVSTYENPYLFGAYINLRLW